MNANSSDIRLNVATDQCTIFSSANHAYTNLTSLSRLSDWSNWRKSIPQERSQPDVAKSCQEATHSNCVSELYKPFHLLHKNVLILLVYLCSCGMVY